MRLQNHVQVTEGRMQLLPAQIEAIYSEVISRRELPARINYKWVTENGVFDITHDYLGNKYYSRDFVYNGKIIYTANRTWVEDPIANKRLPEWMQLPWGTYPDLPEKP